MIFSLTHGLSWSDLHSTVGTHSSRQKLMQSVITLVCWSTSYSLSIKLFQSVISSKYVSFSVLSGDQPLTLALLGIPLPVLLIGLYLGSNTTGL